MPPSQIEHARQRRGELVLFIITALWGTTFVASQDVMDAWPPLLLVSLRFALAAGVFTPVVVRRGVTGSTLRYGLTIGVFLGTGFALQTASLAYTTVSRTAFGTSCVTVLVPVVSFLLLKQRWRAGTWIALLLAGSGIILMMGQSLDGGGGRLGDGMALASAMVFAVQMTLLSQLAPRVELIPLLFIQLVLTALLAGAASFLLGETWPAWRGAPWGTVVYLGVVATALCLLGQVFGQARTSATRAAFIFALEPIFASAFAWLTRQEALAPQEWVGGALIVTAALVADRPLPAALVRTLRARPGTS
ncbi:MAG TPA: EamA family transporter [Myxococcota bacterium]|nr:EamA family transporter [Myxococcota bacterium]